MKLLQIKMRGTGPLLESNWIQLSGGLNQFHFIDAHEGTTFLRALQSLHPLYSFTEAQPFSELPHFEKRGEHTRHIQASKRTIALGVFAATAYLVKELGTLDHNLYETDRVEIGRRLDYSRWLNFVELSSSTRWKEIEPYIMDLLQNLPRQDKKLSREIEELISPLKGSDRVRDGLADRLLSHLSLIDDRGKEKAIFDETIENIKRAAHFQTARQLVFERMPLLVYFNEHGDINFPQATPTGEPIHDHNELTGYLGQLQRPESYTTTDNIVERIETGIDLAITASRTLKRMPPIFLFDAPETRVTGSDIHKLAQLIATTAKTYQCCYLCRNAEFFRPAETARNYTCSDLKVPNS